jgi:hypothetical protein
VEPHVRKSEIRISKSEEEIPENKPVGWVERFARPTLLSFPGRVLVAVYVQRWMAEVGPQQLIVNAMCNISNAGGCIRQNATPLSFEEPVLDVPLVPTVETSLILTT